MFERFMTDEQVVKRYTDVIQFAGDVLSYLPSMGECAGFISILKVLVKWEREYAKRGYRPLPIGDIIDYGGYGIPSENLGVRRAENEDPVFHAKDFYEAYLKSR